MEITRRTWIALFALGLALVLMGPVLPLTRSVALLLFLAALLTVSVVTIITILIRELRPVATEPAEAGTTS